jgi:hypothetical protein
MACVKGDAMKRALLFVALIACGSVAFAADPDNVLTADGLGTIAIGIPVDRLERVLRSKVVYNPYLNRGCSVTTTPEMEPRGVSFTIEKKLLTRINLDFYGTDPRPLAIKTDTGVGLGSPEDDVTKAYGNRVRIAQNPGDPTWHTLYVDTSDHSRGIIFETDGKRVKSIRAGEYPTIAGDISCSYGEK